MEAKAVTSSLKPTFQWVMPIGCSWLSGIGMLYVSDRSTPIPVTPSIMSSMFYKLFMQTLGYSIHLASDDRLQGPYDFCVQGLQPYGFCHTAFASKVCIHTAFAVRLLRLRIASSSLGNARLCKHTVLKQPPQCSHNNQIICNYRKLDLTGFVSTRYHSHSTHALL